jgi:hypothetical protein
LPCRFPTPRTGQIDSSVWFLRKSIASSKR